MVSTAAHAQILMCTRNGAPWIEEQLDSFLGQTYPHWSLWVSDDGSDDNTLSILHRFAKKHPSRVARIITGPGRGSAANFLHLICHRDLPSGIVALSDQDDVWMPDKLARATSQLRSEGDAPCVWSARYFFNDASLGRPKPSPLWPRPPSLGNAVAQNILSGHTLTLNAAALQIIRKAGPVEVPHHDWWIYLLMTATRARVLCDPHIALHYRQHGHNTVGKRAGAQARQTRVLQLSQGVYHSWVATNLRALRNAPVTLTPEAAAFLDRWLNAGRWEKIRIMQEYDIHRQSRAETALIHLAAALGRL